MLNYLLTLNAFEHWANAHLFDALKTAPDVPPRSLELSAHIMAAHEFMGLALHGKPVSRWEYDFFPKYSLDRCRALNEEFRLKWPDLFRSLPLPREQQTFSSIGPDGQPRTGNVLDLITHLHTHSMYHRGQITVDLRSAGLQPVPTDYITFRRASAEPR
jgi:uncharacterized damage-inducible protein DinB